MPAPGILGFHGLVIGFLLFLFLFIRRQWRKKEEVVRLLEIAAAESSASAEYQSSLLPPEAEYRCAVCLVPTKTRCSRCKAVRYCSSKCQILHWRQGHKDECHPHTPLTDHEEVEFVAKTVLEKDDLKLYADAELVHANSPSPGTGNESSVKVSHNRVGIRKSQARAVSPVSSASQNDKNNASEARTLTKKKSQNRFEEVAFSSDYHKDKDSMFSDVKLQKRANKKSTRAGVSSEYLNDDSVCVNLSSSNCLGSNPVKKDGEGETTSSNSILHTKVGSRLSMPQAPHNGLKTSMQKVVQHFRASLPSKSSYLGAGNEVTGKSSCKITFAYEHFMELYSCDGVELRPFGLVNCGNSCYANAVLQCLAYTRPLTSYLVRGLHSRACQKKDWCFICEFECLILEARKGGSPVSPIKILSKIQKIGKHLGPGREEDAHEFLRYAVDTMQSVFLEEAGATGPFAEETTLVGLTFGGYLHSKIKCMNCCSKSEHFERMMDLTVEIDGDIGSLEEALAQFTANEILEGENKYRCSRCKSYQKAKKKLTVLEAPNVLTIVLKRFQSGNFGKLSKSIQFPEVLNMAPYMSAARDSSPMYSLYAVVVHLDVMNAAYSGHYVCYVKTLLGNWFRIDDSTVMPVELETVLLEGAYMLLYARHSPRPPASVRKNMESHSRRSKEINLQAIPSSHNDSSKANSILRTEHSVTRQKRYNKPSFNPGDWRPYSVQSMLGADSSSESSSILSSSDASSCSTTSTKDSRAEDFSEYLFGGAEPSCYSCSGVSSNPVTSSSSRLLDVGGHGLMNDCERDRNHVAPDYNRRSYSGSFHSNDDSNSRDSEYDCDGRSGTSSRRTSWHGSTQTFY